MDTLRIDRATNGYVLRYSGQGRPDRVEVCPAALGMVLAVTEWATRIEIVDGEGLARWAERSGGRGGACRITEEKGA